jgi:C1A family cysteine protease
MYSIIMYTSSGIAALVIILAGMEHMTSGNDPAKTDRAKTRIMYAIAGMIIIIIACPLVDYLVTNTKILPFQRACDCLAGRVKVTTTIALHIATTTTTTILGGLPTSSTTSSSTTSTSSPALSACEEYKASGAVPDSWDWKNVNGQNYVTGVRDQKLCGSCWAHATCGSMEGTFNVEKKTPGTERDFSEEFLMSCFGNDGCDSTVGPNQVNALFSFVTNTGVTDEVCFPYTATSQQCTSTNKCSDWSSRVNKIASSGQATTATQIKGELICHGPLFVASDSWAHAVTLVGYNSNGWIIKNSWGTAWSSGGQPPGFGVVNYNDQYGDLTQHAFWVQGLTGP